MAEKTLEDCAKALEGLKDIKGVEHLIDSLRKNEIPIMLIGNLNNTGRTLARVTDRIGEIVREEQRKELAAHG
jgi:ribonucleotide monophosphatase NagD (HAD superfamily)